MDMDSKRQCKSHVVGVEHNIGGCSLLPRNPWAKALVADVADVHDWSLATGVNIDIDIVVVSLTKLPTEANEDKHDLASSQPGTLL